MKPLIVYDECTTVTAEDLQRFAELLDSRKAEVIVIDSMTAFEELMPTMLPRIVEEPLTWQSKIYDDQTYMHRERKNTGARKQQRAAKARRRKK